MSATPPAKRANEGGKTVDPASKRRFCVHPTKLYRVSRMEIPTVTDICCLLATRDEELFVATHTAIYLKAHGRFTLIAGHPSEIGFMDGEMSEARFNGIYGLALMPDGRVFLTDNGNHSVRLVSPSGKVTTVVGDGQKGFSNGIGREARFNGPHGIVVDSKGHVFVTDTCNHCIRSLFPFFDRWAVRTVYGKGEEKGYANGVNDEVRFNSPKGLAFNSEEELIVADYGNQSVRKVTSLSEGWQNLEKGLVTTVAGPLDGADFQLNYISGPYEVVVDGSNLIFFSDHKGLLFQISEKDRTITTLSSEIDNDRVGLFITMSIDHRGRLVFSHVECDSSVGLLHAGLVTPISRATTYNTLRSVRAKYAAMLADESLKDALFSIDNRVFRAHRKILGHRNTYFTKLFQDNAATDEQILIKGVSGPVFEIVLFYMYTGIRPPITAYTQDVSVFNLALAAKTFDLPLLYEDCLKDFNEKLDILYLVDDLIEAHDSELLEFRDSALKFIQKNAVDFCLEEISSLDAFKSRPDLIGLLLDVTKALGNHISV